MSLPKHRRILAGLSCAVLTGMLAMVLLVPGGRSGNARAGGLATTLVTCNGVTLPLVGALNLGTILAGLPLVQSQSLCNPPAPGQPVTVPFTSVIYGDCTATPEEGCAPPLEVQTWPECRRNLGLYSTTDAAGNQQAYPHTMSSVDGGLPVATFDGGTRTEIYTGATTIVVFADDPTLMQQTVAAISALEAPLVKAGNAAQLAARATGGTSC